MDGDDDNLNSITRSKRDADSYDYMITPTRTRCPLLLVADYRFFREMGGGDTKTTINYLVSVKPSVQININFFFFCFHM